MQAPSIRPLQLRRSRTPSTRLALQLSLAGLTGLALIPLTQGSSLAGPLVCTTSLEAPIMATRDVSGGLVVPPSPVEVTRCAPVESVPQLMERRAYSWTSPYARGVSLTNQITDILGIAMGGINGNRVMGLGFPDQTLVWDGTAIHNTAYALLEQQANPMPLRTPDLASVFSSSLGSGRGLAQPPSPQEGGRPSVYLSPPLPPVDPQGSRRGLW